MAEGDVDMASSAAASAAADSSAAAAPADVGDESASAAAGEEERGDSDSEAAGEEEEETERKKKHKKHKKRKVRDSDDESGDSAGGGSSDSDGSGKRSKKHKKHKKHKKARRPGAQFIDDIAVNEDDEDEPDEESDDSEEEDNGDGEPDDGEDLMDDNLRRRDDAEDDDAAELESPAERKARKKAEKLAARHGGRHRSHLDLSAEDETMHMTLDQIRDKEEAEKLQAQVADRYRDAAGYDDYDEDGANDRSRGSVLPSIKDPSLFLIKLRRGVDEREALRALLKEYQIREDGKDESRKLQILSAFTTPASRGCIYVEAFREVHLKAALQSVPLGRAYYSYYAQSTQNIKVPIAEMVAALKFRTEERTVQEGQWVRMKRGPFKDDLARVVRLQDQGALITIKLLPRINYLFLEAKRHNEKLSAADWARARPHEAARRPPQKLFDRDEVASLGFGKQIERKHGTHLLDKDTWYYTFMNMRFKGGFLFKDVKIDALQLENVLPTADELDQFASRVHNSDDDEDDEAEQKAAEDSAAAAHAAAQNAPRRPTVYSLNDRVLITGGALKDVTGRVRRIEKDRLHIAPDNVHMGVSEVQEVFAHVRKYFTVSTHVKVVSGIYKDESGMVTHVFDADSEAGPDGEQQLALHTDVSLRDIIVSAQDVIESSEISTGRDTFGNFALGDLVQLRGDLTGVIIRINVSSMVVLTSTGVVQDVRLQEVAFKRNDRFARTHDKNLQDVELDDVVYPLTGPWRGKKATVKHIYKKVLFLYSPEVMDNSGLFTMRGDQVALPQAMQKMGMNAPKSPSAAGARSPGPAPRSPGRDGAFGFQPAGAGAPPMRTMGGRPLRDPLIGRDVKITGGQYKGYVGVCLDVVDNQARVEIRAVFRKVQVPRNQLTPLENVAARAAQAASGHAGVMYGGATPLIGGATPAHAGMGAATPAYEGLGGSMTPYGGSRTPSHRTPSHEHGGADVWAPQTPAHRQEDRPVEEDEEEEWRASMQDADARTGGVNPVTPGGVPPQTPRTPYAPTTPYEPTTPHAAAAGGDVEMAVPQTPATPYDPSAMGAAAAADAEEEEEAAPAEPEGLFTSQECVGCHVHVADSGDAVFLIVSIDDEYQVHVRPLSSSRSAATRAVSQSECLPVPPTEKSAGKEAVVLTGPLTGSSSELQRHERITLMSFMGEQVLITRADKEADVLPVKEMKHLCVAEKREEAADAHASSSKSKKKGSRKR